MTEILMYAKRYTVEISNIFVEQEQCYHLTRTSTDAEAVAVRLIFHFIGRDINQSHTPLYAYMLNSIKHYPYLIKYLIP